MFEKAFSVIIRIEGWIIRILLAIMAGVVCLGAINRFTLSIPMAWSDELVRYLLPWMSFIAVAVGVTYNTHVGIDILVTRFNPKVQLWIERVVNCFAIVLSCILIYIGIMMTKNQMYQYSPSMHISMAWYYASLPVGWFLIGLAFIERTIRSFKPNYAKEKIKLMQGKEGGEQK